MPIVISPDRTFINNKSSRFSIHLTHLQPIVSFIYSSFSFLFLLHVQIFALTSDLVFFNRRSHTRRCAVLYVNLRQTMVVAFKQKPAGS